MKKFRIYQLECAKIKNAAKLMNILKSDEFCLKCDEKRLFFKKNHFSKNPKINHALKSTRKADKKSSKNSVRKNSIA